MDFQPNYSLTVNGCMELRNFVETLWGCAY